MMPSSPVVIAVPHAGRDYPAALIAAARLPEAALASIEDRHADALARPAVAGGTPAIVARRARAWIDLNRDPREIDRTMIEPPLAEAETMLTAKVRGGLGLVPRRIADGGEIWRRRLTRNELAARIADAHRPYHAAIAAALDRAQARFGVAVLLDLHSMPSLPRERGRAGATMVVGDCHGRSAARALVDRVVREAERGGVTIARNEPYSGGYTLDRHGEPLSGRHALQLEIDRAAYLAPGLRAPSSALPRVAALVAAIVTALADEALANDPLPLAAE